MPLRVSTQSDVFSATTGGSCPLLANEKNASFRHCCTSLTFQKQELHPSVMYSAMLKLTSSLRRVVYTS